MSSNFLNVLQILTNLTLTTYEVYRSILQVFIYKYFIKRNLQFVQDHSSYEIKFKLGRIHAFTTNQYQIHFYVLILMHIHRKYLEGCICQMYTVVLLGWSVSNVLSHLFFYFYQTFSKFVLFKLECFTLVWIECMVWLVND